MKIGIISDTHNVLRDEVINDLKACDMILHAGDVMKVEIIEQLQHYAPTYVVKGNNDKLDIPESLFFEREGYRFYMVHQIGDKQDVDFYIYGHSHRYACYRDDGVCYINPGSCGRRRFSLPLTYCILYIEKDEYRIEKRVIEG